MSAVVHTFTRAPRAADGFIVVAVLWILSALAALVSVYAIYVANTAVALSVNDDPVVAEGLVSAGVELAAYRLISVPKDARPTRGEFAFRMGKANVAVGFRGETARIDLNAAPKELLAGLLGVLGAQPNEAQQYADRIIGWRTPASQEREASLYRQAGLNYGPRGAPFAHVAELWLVAGLPPALVERALPHVTVFSGRAEINAGDAAPEVVAALPGMSPARLGALLAQGAERALDGRAVLPGTTTEGGDAVRVTVRIAFDKGRHLAFEVVILVRDFVEDPFRVLSWREDFDAQFPVLRPRAGLRP